MKIIHSENVIFEVFVGLLSRGEGAVLRFGLDGAGCAADASNPIPMFRGHFGENMYPCLGIF